MSIDITTDTTTDGRTEPATAAAAPSVAAWMTRVDSVCQRRLADDPAATAGPLAIAEGPLVAEVDLAAVDRFACQVGAVTVTVAAGPVADVGVAAGRIAARVRDLAEPLAVCEHDAAAETAIVRSATVRPIPGEASTYEQVRITPGRAELTAVVVGADGQRRSVPLTLTRETLARLIAEVGAALTSR